MAWFILIIAALFEVGLIISLSNSNGFKNIKWTVLAIVAQLISLFLLSQAVKVLPLNVAYATWTGLGAAGSLLYGVLTKKEDFSVKKGIFLSLLLCGIILLKISE